MGRSPRRPPFSMRTYIGAGGVIIRLTTQRDGGARVCVESDAGVDAHRFATLRDAEHWLSRNAMNRTLVMER